MSKLFVTDRGFSDQAGTTPPIDETLACRSWLRRFGRRRTVNPGDRWWASYWLAHVAARWTGFTVSNGAFIQAAIDLGYAIHQGTGEHSKDAYFPDLWLPVNGPQTRKGVWGKAWLRRIDGLPGMPFPGLEG